MEDSAAKKDLETYIKTLCQNNVSLCLRIERQYRLDGYPPNIVGQALGARANGLDMYKFLDEVILNVSCKEKQCIAKFVVK